MQRFPEIVAKYTTEPEYGLGNLRPDIEPILSNDLHTLREHIGRQPIRGVRRVGRAWQYETQSGQIVETFYHPKHIQWHANV